MRFNFLILLWTETKNVQNAPHVGVPAPLEGVPTTRRASDYYMWYMYTSLCFPYFWRLCGLFSKSTRPLSLYLVPIIWGNNVDVHFDFILTLTQQNLCYTILMIYFWFMCNENMSCMATSLYWLFKTCTPYSYCPSHDCYIYRAI